MLGIHFYLHARAAQKQKTKAYGFPLLNNKLGALYGDGVTGMISDQRMNTRLRQVPSDFHLILKINQDRAAEHAQRRMALCYLNTIYPTALTYSVGGHSYL